MAEPRRLASDAASPVTGWDFGGVGGGARHVIAVHDFTASGLWFGDLAEACPHDVRLTALDLRGRAASVTAPPASSLTTHVVDVLAVADRAGADSFTVVAHGTGAIVALEVAKTAPRRVERIVLLDGPPMVPTDSVSDWRASATLVDPGVNRVRGTFAHRDALIRLAKQTGRIPQIGMTRALRRAIDAEVVGSGFGWQPRLDPVALQRDWSELTAWSPPSNVAIPIVALRARWGHVADSPPLAMVDLALHPTVIDTTHTGLLTDPEATRTVRNQIMDFVGC